MLPPMTTGPADEPAGLEAARLRRELEQRTLVGQAAAVLLERYQLTAAQAAVFLEEKAREDDREVADVALEILRDRRSREQP